MPQPTDDFHARFTPNRRNRWPMIHAPSAQAATSRYRLLISNKPIGELSSPTDVAGRAEPRVDCPGARPGLAFGWNAGVGPAIAGVPVETEFGERDAGVGG